jgi:hypothetical protein
MEECMKCNCNEQSKFYPAKVRAKVGDYERIVSMQNGYCCSLTGGNSHGVHGLNMLFVLKNEKGAVQFLVYTGWYPNWEWMKNEKGSVMPADLGYHSPTAHYEGQTKHEGCAWLDGADCYYDGSGLNAIEVFKTLVQQGEEAMWTSLEEYHKQVLE